MVLRAKNGSPDCACAGAPIAAVRATALATMMALLAMRCPLFWGTASGGARRLQCTGFRAGALEKFDQQRGGRLRLFEHSRVARAEHDLKAGGACEPCDISVAMGARNHVVLLAPNDRRRHARTVEPLVQRAIVEIGRLEPHE